MAAHCSSSTSGSDQAIDIVYGHGIVNRHGSQEEGLPSNFTEDSEDDAKASNPRDFMAIFREQLCEILEVLLEGSSVDAWLRSDITLSQLLGRKIPNRLLGDTEKAVATANGRAALNFAENAEQKSLRGFVMDSLRLGGYNAAVCKSRWDQTIGHPSGYYEFIDAITEGSKLKNERLFVDIDFKAQFEIARPTNDYSPLLQKIPNLFVGKPDKLYGIVNIMCNAARKSLRDMSIPPCGGIAIRDRGWDATIVRQMNKDNSDTEVYVKAKSKCSKKGDEKVESCDRLTTREEQDSDVNKISALTTALAEAGDVTPSSTKPDTILE
eukprot:PITA_26793